MNKDIRERFYVHAGFIFPHGQSLLFPASNNCLIQKRAPIVVFAVVRLITHMPCLLIFFYNANAYSSWGPLKAADGSVLPAALASLWPLLSGAGRCLGVEILKTRCCRCLGPSRAKSSFSETDLFFTLNKNKRDRLFLTGLWQSQRSLAEVVGVHGSGELWGDEIWGWGDEIQPSSSTLLLSTVWLLTCSSSLESKVNIEQRVGLDHHCWSN